MAVSWPELLIKLMICIQCAQCLSSVDVPLNSAECGKSYFYKVNPQKSYRLIIRPENGIHCSEDYVINFYSESPTGRLCLSQEGPLSRIHEQSVVLTVHDGGIYSRSKLLLKLENYPSVWSQRAQCSETPNITFTLSTKLSQKMIDMKKLKINLTVEDIQSQERKIYMDENYCDGSFDLQESRMIISNRLPRDWDSDDRRMKTPCGVYLKKTTDDTRLCLAYKPSRNLNCDNDWTFVASKAKFDLDPELFLYHLNCSDENATKSHVWCADEHIDALTFIMKRQKRVTVAASPEPQDMFEYQVQDYNDTEDSFHREFVKRLVGEQTSGGGNGGVGPAAILGIVVGVLVIVLLACLVVGYLYRKNRRPGASYEAPKADDITNRRTDNSKEQDEDMKFIDEY